MMNPPPPLRIEYDQNKGYKNGGETHVFVFTQKKARELFKALGRKVESEALTLAEAREIAQGARQLLNASKNLPPGSWPQ